MEEKLLVELKNLISIFSSDPNNENLTPLSLRKNIQAQNYSFDKKKEAYGKKDNIATSFYMTQQILAETTWTPEKIRLRKAAVVSKLNEVFELQ